MSGFKLRHYLFFVVALLAAIALVWPVHAWVSTVRPYLLGLPFSMVWIIIVMASVFLALVLLFIADERDATKAGD